MQPAVKLSALECTELLAANWKVVIKNQFSVSPAEAGKHYFQQSLYHKQGIQMPYCWYFGAHFVHLFLHCRKKLCFI